MYQHIFKRLALSVPVLLGVVLIGFALMKMVPIDLAIVVVGPDASPDEIEAARHRLGLDKPVMYQLMVYLQRLLALDLGHSMISNRPVIDEIAGTIGPTLELMLACIVWATPLGIALGTVAAAYRGTMVDRVVTGFAVIGVSVPIFWVGLMLIKHVGGNGILPFQGRGGPLWTVDGLRHIALPALTLGAVFVGPICRMTRTEVIEALSSDYVRTARAKGVSEGRVIVSHALRNALIPVITLIGMQIGLLFGGAVVTETIFAWPGIGRMAVGAIFSNDYPVVQGAILMLALAFLLVNLVTDLLYSFADPRISLK